MYGAGYSDMCSDGYSVVIVMSRVRCGVMSVHTAMYEGAVWVIEPRNLCYLLVRTNHARCFVIYVSD